MGFWKKESHTTGSEQVMPLSAHADPAEAPTVLIANAMSAPKELPAGVILPKLSAGNSRFISRKLPPLGHLAGRCSGDWDKSPMTVPLSLTPNASLFQPPGV